MVNSRLWGRIDGSLLIADDAGGAIWKVSYGGAK